MKCPRCKATVTGAPDATGLILCLGCGARLRSRPAAKAAVPHPAAAETDGLVAAPAEAPPAAKPRAREPRSVAKAGAETLPPVPARVEAPSELETVLGEIRALRAVQDEILSLLKERSAETDGAAAAMGPDDTVPPPASAVRSRRRKAVLLIDDDEQSRAAAVQALEQAEVPVRTAPDGNAGLAAVAQEKPDVVILELGIDGAMSGKDFVNMVKATMEWVDLPIVLYTRMPIEGQKEARIIHGADELVPKGAGAPEALVQRVIGLFRKG